MSPSFFFNAPSTTDIYTLSLHDALPILSHGLVVPDLLSILRVDANDRFGEEIVSLPRAAIPIVARRADRQIEDRKSTRLNSSHPSISYAVFCLKKKIISIIKIFIIVINP